MGPPPVQVWVAGPAPQRRLTVLLRLILAIPHFIILIFLAIAAAVVAFLGWWGALFMGRLPDFASSYLAGYVRWTSRVSAYAALLTDAYPPFSLDDEPGYPVQIAMTQERLNRAAVFFRFILFIPAWAVGYVLVYGAFSIVAIVAWIIVLITGKLPDSLHQAYTAVFRYQVRQYCYQYLLTPTYPVRGLFGDHAAMAPAPPAGPGAPSGFGTPGGFGTPAGYPDAPGGYPAAPGYGVAPSTDAGPSYGTPGYATPSDGTPGYGAPGYGTPGSVWGTPGDPTYGGYGTAADTQQPPTDPAVWRLHLTSTARSLVIFFIVLGTVLEVPYTVVRLVSNVHSVSNVITTSNAINQMNSSFGKLNTQLEQFQTTTNACKNVTCLTTNDGKLAADLSTFASTVLATQMPASAQSAANRVFVTATKSAQAFTQLSELSPTSNELQYQNAAASSGVAQDLNEFGSDYNALANALNTARSKSR
jgi:hypothetical protein